MHAFVQGCRPPLLISPPRPCLSTQVLKQKKLYESQRTQLYNQQFNVEQTRFTVDNMNDTVSTVQAMTAANDDMKKQFKKTKELDISHIDKLQDDMYDMHVSSPLPHHVFSLHRPVHHG